MPKAPALLSLEILKLYVLLRLRKRFLLFLKRAIPAGFMQLMECFPEAVKNGSSEERISGRTYEIQRTIGRVFRSVTNLQALKGFTITIDCDVVQADGGTRTASITGGWIALYDAVQYMLENTMLEYSPLREAVAAVSVGIIEDTPVLDLSYDEDYNAMVDMNVAMTEKLRFIEVQGTGEKRPFTKEEFEQLISLAEKGIAQIIELQRKSLFLFK